MIVQELCKYYERLEDNPDISISPPGFSREKIHAEIVLDDKGNFLQFNDLRIQKGKKLVPVEMIVPQPFKRTISPIPNFLWDNSSYVLGADNKGKPEKAAECFNLFRQFHKEICSGVENPEISAVLTFLDKWDCSGAVSLNHWDELAGGNIVFRLDGQRQYLHEKSFAKEVWLKYKNQDETSPKAFCLVSGQVQPIARLHASVKGVRGAQSSGAALITFNLDSFCSYGKEQNYNAPVGEISAFYYTTALNYLLANDSKQKIQIGDATVVFWTERKSPIEGMLGMILDPKDEEIQDNEQLRFALEAIRDAKPIPGVDPDMNFYILGLSPNNARISVRFWYVCKLGQLEENIGRHFRDLKIQKSFDSDAEYPGIWKILYETVNKKSSEKAPLPLLAGTVIQSILKGIDYPQGLQNAIMNRIRADQDINYVRAAILKAILIRNRKMEVKMSLDTENKKPAYLLGRLFAVLEKAQQDALGKGINATIKDRFFGSASATPKSVFPQLLRLAQHHIDKAEYGLKNDKLIEEILGDIQDFPPHLTLDEQGLFVIGYYHQRQAFFAKKTETEKE